MSRALTLTLLALIAPALAAVVPQSGYNYTISPASFPALCVAPGGTSEGSSVVTASCDTADDIVWTYNDGTFVNTALNMCVDVTDGDSDSGTKLQVWGCYSDNPNQAFAPSGQNIKWSGQNLCWDLTDGASAAGAKIQIWSCSSGNANQLWDFVEAEEVDACDTETATSSTSVADASSASVSASASSSDVCVDDAEYEECYIGEDGCEEVSSASVSATASAASATSAAAIGDELLADGDSSSEQSWKHRSSTSSPSSTASADGWSSTTSTSSGATSTSTSTSGYLQVSGTTVVDSSGNAVVLRGTNLGGWLVWEDWMCGITDNSGNADRFPQDTLESRFGVDETYTLMKTWQDNWITSEDFDNVAALGFNVVRLPFSYRNFIWANGSYISDGFDKMDWAIAQAKSRGMYVIPTGHIWDGQASDYSQISESGSTGDSQRAEFATLWKYVASHYVGESTIAAYDVINEPTGSAGDTLQQSLYNAVREVDPTRIIIMESISTDPSTYGWTNVIYSIHEYLMMGSDVSSNEAQYATDIQSAIDTWHGFGIPVYVGEFMMDGDTLDYTLGQLNSANVWWSHWAYTTVNMDRWGLYNFGSSMSVDVSSDSYDTILSAWSNMGSKTKQDVASQYSSSLLSRKRDVSQEERAVESPKASKIKRMSRHGGRSRRRYQQVKHAK